MSSPEAKLREFFDVPKEALGTECNFESGNGLKRIDVRFFSSAKSIDGDKEFTPYRGAKLALEASLDNHWLPIVELTVEKYDDADNDVMEVLIRARGERGYHFITYSTVNNGECQVAEGIVPVDEGLKARLEELSFLNLDDCPERIDVKAFADDFLAFAQQMLEEKPENFPTPSLKSFIIED